MKSEYSAEDFIVAEDNHVLVTADGWVKRQKEINPETTRLREGDRILSLVAGSTRATIVFFSNFGTAYTARIIDIPATTGYGEPIQKLFKLKDGEKIVAAISMDDRRSSGEIDGDRCEATGHCAKDAWAGGDERWVLAAIWVGWFQRGIDAIGQAICPAIGGGRGEPGGGNHQAAKSSSPPAVSRRVLLCKADEINFLSGPGKGVLLIKLEKDDRLMGVIVATDERDTLTVKTSTGGEQRLNTGRYKVTGRGGKGT